MTKEIEDLDLGRFDFIDKSKLSLNEDGTYDYIGLYAGLSFTRMNLKSLLEIPIRFRRVSGSFWCNGNQLISLKGAPKEIGGNFNCDFNNLISLQYAPSYIGTGFWCTENLLLSKVNFSKIEGELDFDKNPFSITDKVIDTIKRMTIDQRVSELKFFKENDINAYEMMMKILEENDIGYGPKSKEMVTHTKSLDISNLI